MKTDRTEGEYPPHPEPCPIISGFQVKEINPKESIGHLIRMTVELWSVPRVKEGKKQSF